MIAVLSFCKRNYILNIEESQNNLKQSKSNSFMLHSSTELTHFRRNFYLSLRTICSSIVTNFPYQSFYRPKQANLRVAWSNKLLIQFLLNTFHYFLYIWHFIIFINLWNDTLLMSTFAFGFIIIRINVQCVLYYKYMVTLLS